MKHSRNIIIAPIITEKSSKSFGDEEHNKAYAFKVSQNANKIEIKAAIEHIFKVDVLSVNTMNYNGKPKRQGRYEGFRSDWKKAIVTIKKGQSIAGFDM
jgi:large subunit ribosomal protein L23